MNDMSCPDRSAFGAFASGELAASDAAALGAHLGDCPSCAEEMKSLASVVEALRSADLSRIDGEPFPAFPVARRNLESAIFGRIDLERRRTRIRRVGAGVAAAVLLTVGVVGGLALRSGRSAGGLYLAMDYPVGGNAKVELLQRTWGTEIEIHTTGIPAGSTYGVWLERPDGSRVSAGSFTTIAVPAMTLRFSSALQTRNASAIGMTELTTRKEVRVPLSEATTDGR